MTRRLAVVTGASRGIGRAIALRLATTYDILAIARSRPALDELAAEVRRAGGRCDAKALDLADAAAVAEGLEGVDAHVLVNNAGVGNMKPLLELTPDQWHQTVDVNFNALYHVTRALLPRMIAHKAGHIVIIGSISGRSAFVGGTCYAATKHAAMAFAESLMLEVRDQGVKVSIVNPGSVATEFSTKRDPSWMLSAEEVAESVAHVLDTPPDVLVICGGALPQPALVSELNWDQFSVNWEVDTKMAFLFCRQALRVPLAAGSVVVIISSGAGFSGGASNSGGYAGAKRMQMILAKYCQAESDRRGLGIRFVALVPTNIMPETELGQAAVNCHARDLGLSTRLQRRTEPAAAAREARRSAQVARLPGGNRLRRRWLDGRKF